MESTDSKQKAAKRFKIGLLPCILIAIALGIGAGFIFPEFLVRIFLTFNSLFSSFLTFVIPLIIVGLVTPAIADIGKAACYCWLCILFHLAFWLPRLRRVAFLLPSAP